MNPRLTIDLLGWNGSRHLRETLAALADIPADAAIIRYIDNGSQDHSVEMVRDLLPRAQVIELKENRGFAHAHNVGFSKCTTPYVLTLDQDISLVWEGIEKLLDAMDQHPTWGAIQGKMYRREGKKIIDSAGIVQTLSLNGKERGSNEEDRGQYDTPAKLLAVTGGCGLYRMDALKKVGDFDETFFAYKEDVDLGWRLNKAGWTIQYIPVLVGYHARTMGKRGLFNWGITPSAIAQRVSNMRTTLSLRNYIWMLAKNMTWRQELLHAPFILIRLGILFILSLFSRQLFAAWGQAFQGMPGILKKRN